MSESGDSGPGRREVAHRLFAAEFDDADFSYSESDEERAPNYVVTPTGARINRLFLVGVLTELEQVNDDVLRARVVDPTGPFVIYAGQYQPDELAFLEAADPPMFVAVTGKARTFQPDDSDRVFTSVRPESISEVDAGTRDRWVVQAAKQTVSRVSRMASAKQAGLAGDELRLALVDRGIDESAAAGITLALDHYGTTGDYLDALRTTALDAARVVAGDTDEAEGLSLSPDDGADDPIPLLASLDLDTDVSTPETTADEADADATADEPATETEASETTTEATADKPVSETTESDAGTDEPATETASADDIAETTIDEEPAVSETLSTTEPETVATEPETSTTAASTSEPEPSSGTDADASSETAAESDLDADTTEPETATSTTADSDTASEGDGDLGEFDPEFDLDKDEREEIEQEYGTDFQTGTEVDEPGEAGIETPDPDEEVPAGADAGTESDSEPETGPASATESETEPETAPETAPSAEAGTSSSGAETPAEPTPESDEDDDSGAEPAEDVDLEDAAMEIMDELDDGSGADREELLSTVVDRYGADADAVADAIQDALMGGRCYEPDDGKLKPI